MQSGIQSLVYDKFAQVAGTLLNPSVAEWKQQGRRVLGYFCSFIPEELFIAAGFLPFRMRGIGSCGTAQADAYFDSKNCCFVRHCFDQALSGQYDFLDGLVVGTGCDHIRRVYDNWQHAPLKTPFLHLLDHPRTMGTPEMQGEPMIGYYRAQLAKLKERIENEFGVEVTVPRLRQAVKLCNETRRLQRQLYELRKADHPPITAAETALVMLAGTSMPKEHYNTDLRVLLGELATSPGIKRDYKARLMIVGPAIEDLNFYDLIEKEGGCVVTDDTCFGARTVSAVVDEMSEDPLRAIAKFHVLDTVFCPKINGAHVQRIKVIADAIRDYRVGGIIGQGYVACDPWGTSYALLGPHLKAAGTPFLRLDREYVSTESGQLQTRIQAFLETVGGQV
jgi:benzoyl-CoA reductase/2-hydroxyglutaryl-CoA dehydratase subunit BcrC/BadD/HgdB